MINSGSDKSVNESSGYIKCSCRAHLEDPEGINRLISDQYSFNCSIVEKTQQLTESNNKIDQKGTKH